MCQRFCRLFYSDNQGGCCCLALAPSLIICCVVQLFLVGTFNLVFKRKYGWFWGAYSIVSASDAITGLWAVCTGNALLAFCALIGFFIDFVCHSCLVIYWYVELYSSTMSEPNVLRRLNVLCLGVVRSIVLLSLSYAMLRVVYGYYRVVQLGGDGWERKSPGELKAEHYGQSHSMFEQLDSSEAQRLLDPEAALYKF